jgi:hypothetical protein
MNLQTKVRKLAYGDGKVKYNTSPSFFRISNIIGVWKTDHVHARRFKLATRGSNLFLFY